MGVAADTEADGSRDRLREDTPGPQGPPLEVMVVYGELVQAEHPLTEPELQERTLLPDGSVDAALAALERADAIRVLSPRVDARPTRYHAERAR